MPFNRTYHRSSISIFSLTDMLSSVDLVRLLQTGLCGLSGLCYANLSKSASSVSTNFHRQLPLNRLLKERTIKMHPASKQTFGESVRVLCSLIDQTVVSVFIRTPARSPVKR